MREGREKPLGLRMEWRRGEAGAILILLLLTGTIHAWLIKHTELPARDGVGFIHYAWRLQHEPWGEVLRTSHQHPGYPLAIAIVSKFLPRTTESLCAHMIQSAQLVNLLAGCLLAIVALVGCAVLAVLRPQPSLGNAPIVMGKQSGALYVRVGKTLHPVLNLASARIEARIDLLSMRSSRDARASFVEPSASSRTSGS